MRQCYTDQFQVIADTIPHDAKNKTCVDDYDGKHFLMISWREVTLCQSPWSPKSRFMRLYIYRPFACGAPFHDRN